jgi:MFS family permease
MSRIENPASSVPAAAVHVAQARSGWATLLDLNRYHWFVFVVAALGWLADCMDQQLFNLGRRAAIIELLGGDPAHPDVGKYAGYATSIFLMGWATGGIVFGILGDRWGRVRTMILTILLYSLFTGLSALSVGVWDFALYRFLTGLGVGGEFAVGVALLAETMPERARPFALGLLQAFSAVGNITAALLYMYIGRLEGLGTFEGLTLSGLPVTAWRVLFVVGTVPAVLALIIRRRLREPERWREAAAREGTKHLGSYADLFGDPRWRRNALLGLMLAFAGVVGLWGIGFFSIDLIQSVLRKTLAAEGVTGVALEGQLKHWAGITSLMLNIGAFIGMFGFSWLTHYTGRKPAFALAFVTAAASTVMVFLFMSERSHIFWMLPIMGIFQLSVFGGYAIYFPELFPTRLRSTGTSFCYNVGRFVAAIGPAGLGLLTSEVFYSYAEPMRYAGATMCCVFLIGLLALPFLPETKDKPLPE